MVKAKRIKLLALFFLTIVVIVYPLVRTGCNINREPWRIDSEYSENLTIMATNYAAKTGYNIADTIDSIRIYRIPTKKKDMYRLSTLFKEDLVFETKDKQFIKQFILSAQDTIMSLHGCYENQDQETFHIVVLDNTLKRAGYFMYSLCTIKEGRYGIVVPLQKGGGSSIYFNKALVPILEENIKK